MYPLAFAGATLIAGPFLLWPVLAPPVDKSQLYTVEHLWFVQLAIAVVAIYFYLVLYKRLMVFITGEKVWLPGIFINAFARLVRAYVGLIISVIIICLGFILFFPGFYFLVSYAFFIPLLVLKDKRAWPTLKESFNLVRGHWWRTALVVIPPIIIFTGTGYMANFFVMTLWNSAGLSMDVALPLTTLTLSCFITALFSPLYFSIVVVQLQDLFCRQVDEATAERMYWEQKLQSQ